MTGMKGLGTANVVYSSVSLASHGVATMNLPPDKYILSWFAEDLDMRADEEEDQNVLMMGTAGRLYMASSAVGSFDGRQNLEVDLKPSTRTLLSFDACNTAAEEPRSGPSIIPADSGGREQERNSGQSAQVLTSPPQIPPRPLSPVRDCSAISGTDQTLVPLSEVCEFVKTMDHALPNFTCDQTTQRYFPIGPGKRNPEQRRDDDTIQSTVSATVTYENGIDQYGNVRVGNQPVQSQFVTLTGSITTGDFGSGLLSIFRQENAARFSFSSQTDASDGREYVFDFQIPATMNRAFTLYENGLSTHPEINGALWISAETHEVRRLEILATKIDSAFSSDHVRFNTELGKVQFGDAGDYLLPKESETTECTRRGLCTHNVTQWTNCKRLAAKSRIIFSNY